jgi:hypothetical protein
MLLSDIFLQLTHGELAGLAIGGAEGNGVLPHDRPAIISHINLGLTELHKRFDLRREEVIVQQYDHIQKYYLEKKYAVHGSGDIVSINPPIFYIKDSVEHPFEENVLRIEQVINEKGEELYKNDENSYWSVWCPQFNCVQVPYADSANSMCIKYRASHERIDPSPNTIPEEVDIHFPDSHLQALLNFVAARIHASKPTMDGITGSAEYTAKFEASCVKLKELNLEQKDTPSNQKLLIRGFV